MISLSTGDVVALVAALLVVSGGMIAAILGVQWQWHKQNQDTQRAATAAQQRLNTQLETRLRVLPLHAHTERKGPLTAEGMHVSTEHD